MRATPLLPIGMIAMAIGLSGCEMIGDIIQFGIWVGVIFAAVIVAIIYWLYRKFRGR